MALRSTRELTADRARQLLAYDPETGVITWKVRRNGRNGGVRPGDVAGSVCPVHGYVIVGVDGVSIPGHRIAWLLMTDDPLPPQLDHRNGVRTDNRWANLRASAHGLNQQNTAQRQCASGYRGVYASGSKWQAQISFRRKKLYLGSFATPEEASEAYLDARKKSFMYQPVPREAAR